MQKGKEGEPKDRKEDEEAMDASRDGTRSKGIQRGEEGKDGEGKEAGGNNSRGKETGGSRNRNPKRKEQKRNWQSKGCPSELNARSPLPSLTARGESHRKEWVL